MPETPTLGPPTIQWGRAATWATSRGAPAWWSDLARLVWVLDGHVRPEVMWAQACKETGFGRFLRPDGTPSPATNPTMRNPCGLKPPDGAGNDDPHHTFPTWTHGFLAQHDHLALYAGADGYPQAHTPDPRHFAWLHGRAPTVEALSSNWAGVGYGESIVADYLTPLIGWGS